MDEITIETIKQLHNILNYNNPKHPLISIIDYTKVEICLTEPTTFSTGFYSILLKDNFGGELTYGRRRYDFTEGTLLFSAPGQSFTITPETDIEPPNGWGLYFHPDLIRTHDLARKMKDYNYFDYSLFEGLHISDDEKHILEDILEKINREFSGNIDKHTERLIVSNLELFLNYCQRFYDRQFVMRSKFDKGILAKFQKILINHFDNPLIDAFPTVHQLAESLSLSPKYLSDFLKKETGMNAQQHIHYQMVETAKDRLLDPELKTISEISYSLGFEYPQYFSRIFKKKTGLTPSEYRSGLNRPMSNN